jgi:hypothetical protein
MTLHNRVELAAEPSLRAGHQSSSEAPLEAAQCCRKLLRQRLWHLRMRLCCLAAAQQTAALPDGPATQQHSSNKALQLSM